MSTLVCKIPSESFHIAPWETISQANTSHCQEDFPDTLLSLSFFFPLFLVIPFP